MRFDGTPGVRARLIWLLAAGFVLACGTTQERGVAIADSAGAAAGYNVLLVTLDTTRSDRLGCYGHADASTPTLDRLAAEGARVVDAVTVAPVTLPAHASILTGLYPPEHGVRDNGEFRLESGSITLAERLASEGYATAAFTSAFVLDARFGLDQGFEVYDDSVASAGRAGSLIDHASERDATATTDAALTWLEALDPAAPFFAWVHYFDPHQPYTSRPGALAHDPYDAEIEHVDGQIQRLLDALATSGRGNRTLTVVVADHGEGLGEHDEETHTLLIYGSTMRVPLLLHAPGALAASQVLDDRVVSVVDVVPTVLDMLGLSPAADVDGLSLAGDAETSERLVYMESLVAWLDYGWAPLHGIRRHQDKWILAPEPEYFDLNTDPDERVNLAKDTDGAVRARRERLESELATWLATWPAATTIAVDADTLDAESIARLESLGYVAGGSPRDTSLLDPKSMMPVVRALDRAKGLAAAGRFDEALQEIEGIEEQVTTSRALLGQLARIYVRTGREADAATMLERYLAIRPSTQALVMLAQIRLAQGNAAAAGPLLDQAFELDPRHGSIHIAWGDLALMGGDVATARKHYLEAGRVDPYRATSAMRQRLTMLRARAAR